MGNDHKIQEPVKRNLTKKEHAHYKKDAKQQLILFGGVGVVALLVIGFLGWGLVADQILKPNATVASVNGVSITRSQYEKVRKYDIISQLNYIQAMSDSLSSQSGGENQDLSSMLEQYQQQYKQLYDELQNLKDYPANSQTVDQMVNGELISQKAGELGVSITDEELKAEAVKQFEPRPEATATPEASATPDGEGSAAEGTATPEATATASSEATETPAPTPTQTAEEAWNSFVGLLSENLGMSEQEYLNLLFRPQILQERVQAKLAEQVPESVEQVHAAHILLADEAEAKKTLEEIQKGAAFEGLAKERSTDTGSKENGGDLGWFPRGVMVKEFEDAAFALQPGELSEVVKSQFGYHIIKVIEHEKDRKLDDSTRQQLQSKAFSTWLEDQRAKSKIETPAVAAEIAVGSEETPTP